MGLLSKKEPCPICGGKVPRFLASKVGGVAICSACYGNVDLPDGVEESMTFDEFLGYRDFREENAKLRDVFQITDQIDFGWLDNKFLFDHEHGLLCMDKKLRKTIFQGREIASFVIAEDENPVFVGTPEGVYCYASSVPKQVMAMAPQLRIAAAQREMERQMNRALDEMERQYRENEERNGRDGRQVALPPRPHINYDPVDISEPFHSFNIVIEFDHPYWSEIAISTDGPHFNNDYPSVDDYMRRYQESMGVMQTLAENFRLLAFPDVDIFVESDEENPETGTGAEDPVETLRRLKTLVDEGVLTEEEFAAKKRKVLDI